MEYHGKLYGKLGNSYFPLQETSDDVDKMKNALKEILKITPTEDDKIFGRSDAMNNIESLAKDALKQ